MYPLERLVDSIRCSRYWICSLWDIPDVSMGIGRVSATTGELDEGDEQLTEELENGESLSVGESIRGQGSIDLSSTGVSWRGSKGELSIGAALGISIFSGVRCCSWAASRCFSRARNPALRCSGVSNQRTWNDFINGSEHNLAERSIRRGKEMWSLILSGRAKPSRRGFPKR